MKVLTGDIGGTKTRLAVVELAGGKHEIGLEQVYPSADYPSLDAILTDYTQGMDTAIDRAGFGVAGPVRDGRSETTNLPWCIDAGALAAAFGWQQVALLNDLEAVAWGIEALDEQDVCVLNAGAEDVSGNRAVIAAGTGLGEAGLCRRGGHDLPFASEGGHAAFAPAGEREIALLEWLARRYDHVSWERVVSGPGLVNIHAFLRDYHRTPAPDWLSERLQSGDSAAAISTAALNAEDAICTEALDMFVRCYGAEAGNQALKLMATGGVYLAGGIVPKILSRLQQGDFLEAFCAKGRMSALLRAMPVRVILNKHVALLGPARYTLATAAVPYSG